MQRVSYPIMFSKRICSQIINDTAQKKGTRGLEQREVKKKWYMHINEINMLYHLLLSQGKLITIKVNGRIYILDYKFMYFVIKKKTKASCG